MDILKIQITALQEMMNWRVSLDIILITLIIFAIYRLFRWTGTWKILAGILIAGIIFFIARMLNLSGIQWIYATLSPVVVIAFIVIFQPEIRRILEKAASIYQKQSVSQTPEMVQQLNDVVHQLAKEKWGGLIVIPGRDSIQPWVSKGITLNADPSIPLLVSLFDPHSSGHDGAVIISNNKISSFGVRLPLSTSGSLSSEYGTRHYAALGLSEKTDAMVIVVSEERGTINLFARGKMNQIKKPDEFNQKVSRYLQNRKRTSLLTGSIRTKINYMIELICCFIIAVIFWSSVVLSSRSAIQSTREIVAEPEPQLAEPQWFDYEFYITPELIGSPASGYTIDTVFVYPKKVKGNAQSYISNADTLRIRTTPILIDSLRTNIKTMTQLNIPPEFQIDNPPAFVDVLILIKKTETDTKETKLKSPTTSGEKLNPRLPLAD